MPGDGGFALSDVFVVLRNEKELVGTELADMPSVTDIHEEVAGDEDTALTAAGAGRRQPKIGHAGCSPGK
eukprot:CAMPEP_0194329394 /NCGR_PEP_ID=MMETSP0171-20130528/48157_1 /TAXON_ID=218684 /ORGANISM="Corethron pennatum, Strain L29A3" /LENGTH=69 /DNA_ID=CAMNT_0039090123 /DNA_START=616 /DNA_END=825 /DNA_ORIENTATION=+